MDATRLIENISDSDLKYYNFKKSILLEKIPHDETSIGSIKRGMSKTQIQWKEVPGKAEEERKVFKTSTPVVGLLASRGGRWHYIHHVLVKLRLEESKHVKQSEEEILKANTRCFNNLIQDLGSKVLQKRYNKNADLTLDQETHLEILKHKVKGENEVYLRQHPEIDVMIKLVYAALFKYQPSNPKMFVADYVHYLNKHREELVVEEVDIPFDRPVVPEETTSEEEERSRIREFAHQIVESCLDLAALGESYVDVMSIINSMLKEVSTSSNDISIESTITNAEDAVSEILMSLLSSVAIEKSTSAELVVEKVLSIIISNALPFVERDSQVYSEMKESTEHFINNLLGELTDKVMTHISIGEKVTEGAETKYETKLSVEGRTISILKKEDEENLGKSETKFKVKFQSLPE